MAYTAELIGRNPLVVKFTDGANSHHEKMPDNIRNEEDLRGAVKRRIDVLDAQTVVDAIPLGAVGAPTPPPAPDTVADTFRDNDRKLTAALRAVDKGLLQSNDSRIASIQSDMSDAIGLRPGLIFLIN